MVKPKRNAAWVQPASESRLALTKEFETLSEALRKDIRAELQKLAQDVRESMRPFCNQCTFDDASLFGVCKQWSSHPEDASPLAMGKIWTSQRTPDQATPMGMAQTWSSQRSRDDASPLGSYKGPHFDESSSDEETQPYPGAITPPGEPEMLRYDLPPSGRLAPPPREPKSPLVGPSRVRSKDILGPLVGRSSMLAPPSPPPIIAPENLGPIRKCLAMVANLLNKSLRFNLCLGGFILLNSISIGMMADFEVNNPNEEERAASDYYTALKMIDAVFLSTFSLEMLVRLGVNGVKFFTMPGWAWNVFDFTIISTQLTEQIMSFIISDGGGLNLVVLRVLRVLALIRLVRVLRIVRVARLLNQFRVIVNSLFASFVALFWTLNLLILLQYCTAVFFTQLTAEHMVDNPESVEANAQLQQYFGSLLRAQLTLFESVTGGLDWGTVVDLLGTEVGGLGVVVFTGYVAFSQIAMMNVVTGVFVESVVSSHKKNGDKMVLRLIRGMFGSGTQCVTWDDFQEHMLDERFQNLLRTIELDPNDASRLFKLLDRDGSGSLDAVEFLHGVVRLKGPAKALDLAFVVEELFEQRKMVQELISAMRPLPVVAQSSAGMQSSIMVSSPPMTPMTPIPLLEEMV